MKPSLPTQSICPQIFLDDDQMRKDDEKFF